MLKSSWKESGGISRIREQRGYEFLAVFFFVIVLGIFSVFLQYLVVYVTDPLMYESFGLVYKAPSLFYYFIPFVAVSIIISFIPFVAFVVRKKENLRIVTILGVIMSGSGLIIGPIFHIAFAALIFVYVVGGILVIWLGDQLRKDRESEFMEN